MDLQEKLDKVVRTTKELKEAKVSEDPSKPDLAMYLHFFRGDTLPMVAQCRMDRDTALETAWIGSMGFSATDMVLTSEAYHASQENSPITGEPWQHHELQYVCETMPESGAVSECVTNLAIDRDGRIITNLSCYRITDGVLEWTEEILLDEPEAEKHGGVMVRALRDAMERPLLADKLDEATDALGVLMTQQLGEVATEFHCDMATWRTLTEKDLVTNMMMGAEPGSERYQLIQDRLGEPDA